MNSSPAKWPKVLPPLSPEIARTFDEFIGRWHVELAGRSRYAALERFNHLFPVANSRPDFKTTLEIGAGLGEHLEYERLTPEQEAHYYANEMRPTMAAELLRRHPRVRTLIGDCQQRFDLPDGFLDRYIAVHVLEHLPNLPAAIREAYRLLHRDRGQMLVVIPCEGSPAYGLARKVSAQRLFEKTYGLPYKTFISREHINLPTEILEELAPYFVIEKRRYFPFPFLPFAWCNLVIGLRLAPRPLADGLTAHV